MKIFIGRISMQNVEIDDSFSKSSIFLGELMERTNYSSGNVKLEETKGIMKTGYDTF